MQFKILTLGKRCRHPDSNGKKGERYSGRDGWRPSTIYLYRIRVIKFYLNEPVGAGQFAQILCAEGF